MIRTALPVRFSLPRENELHLIVVINSFFSSFTFALHQTIVLDLCHVGLEGFHQNRIELGLGFRFGDDISRLLTEILFYNKDDDGDLQVCTQGLE